MELNIFGKVVPIVYKNIRDRGFEGLFDSETFTITVDDKSKQKLATTVHELIHSVHFRVGLAQAKIHPDIQEVIAETLSIAIAENFEVLVQLYLLDKEKPTRKHK